MKWRLFLAGALVPILGAAVFLRMERPGLAEESWTSIYYPQAALGSADGLSFTTQLTLYNPQPESVTALPSFISASGEEQEWEPVTLGPNESGLVTLESDGPLSVGQLQLSTSAPIGESLKYVITQANRTTREEISVGSTDPATEFILPVNNDGIHRTAFAVANPASEMLSLALTLFDSDGFIVQEGELELPALGQLARYIHELEGFAFVKPGFMGSLHIQSSAAFTAMGLAENQKDNHLSSLRPFSPRMAGGVQISEDTFVAHYPQSAYGFHVDNSLMVSTKLTVFNPHEEEVAVRALFFDHTGKLQQEIRSTVPPHGLRIIEPSAASLVVGQAQLIADRPVGQVLTYLFTNPQGRIVEEISVKETLPSKRYSIPVEISDSHTSSFAIASVADRPITIHAFLVNEEGEKGEETQFELGRGEQRARFFSEVFSGLGFFTGTAQFWSNEGELVLMGLSTNRNDQHLSSLAGTRATLDSSVVEVTLRAGDFNLSEISGTATFLLGTHDVQAKGHTTFWVPEGDYELNIISPSHWPEVLDIRRGFFGEYGPIRDTADPPDKPVIVSIGSTGYQEEFVGLLMDNLGIYEIPGLSFEAFYTKERVYQFLSHEDGYKYEFVNKQAIEGLLENATGFDPTQAFQRWRDIVNLQNSYGKGLHRIQIDQEAIPEAIAAASQAQGTLVLQVSNSAFSDAELQSDQRLISSAIASVPGSEGTKWKRYAGRLLEASAGVKSIVVSDSGQESEVVSVEDVLANGENDLDLEQGLSPVAEKLTGLALHLRRSTFLRGHFVEEPAIQLEKSTNGEDADTTPGPSIQQGDPVNWTYEVINTGNVLLSNVSVSDNREGPVPCDQTTLGAGESMICASEGVAEAGQYGNIGTVSAESVLGTEVSADDPSHYLGVDSCYLLTLSHTGSGSDPVPSPESSEGCPSGRYHSGQMISLAATPDSGWVVAGWTNTNDDASTSNENQVTMPGEDLEVTVNYVEEGAAITIEKFTNGQDADTPPGPAVTIGDEVRWTFEVANTGNITLTNIIVTDDQLGSICSQDELEPAVEMTCIVTATAQLGQYENIGNAVGSPQGDLPDVSDSDPSHYLGVTDAADLKVTKSTPAVEVFEGDILPYSIDVANLGPSVASGVVITDTLPAGTAFVSASDQCSYSGGEVVCALGDLEAESGAQVAIDVEIGTTGFITNTVVVNADQPDPAPANDVFEAVTAVAPRVDLAVNKTASTDAVVEGDLLAYTVNVINDGTSVATTVLITDTLPASVDFVFASPGCSHNTGTVACNLGDLPGQGSGFVEIEVRVMTAGILVNTVETASEQADINPANNFFLHELTATSAQPTITIEKYTNGQNADIEPGPTIPVGDDVSWTFEVTNTGNITLTNVIVTDDQIGEISCPMTELGPDQFIICSEIGIATAGQHTNLATATGTPRGGLPDVSASDPSHYFGGTPGIAIEKRTNGQDADQAPGPYILAGEAVQWTYYVTNTGSIPLTNVQISDDRLGEICTRDTVAIGESFSCIANGVAQVGQYLNFGLIQATQPFTTTDPSHYFGVVPTLTIEKSTNGQNADIEPGPTIPVGDDVSWTFEVTNTGNITLTNVIVIDDQIGEISCPMTELGPDQFMICSEIGIATAGQHTNMATVSGKPPDGLPDVSDSDPSHYFGGTPGVAIEKRTNGQDADQAPGPYILAGEAVQWTYYVTNTGSIPLTNVQISDDRLGEICTRDTVAIGESFSCIANGVAQVGQYLNFGLIQATQPFTTTDPSHYFGAVPTLTIEKYTNGQNADIEPGPTIPVGDDVSWTFEVANTGNITLTNVIVIDDQIGEISCPVTELGPDQFMICSEIGIATAGQHTNMATVSGKPPDGLADVSDSDPSHYFGGDP